MIEWKNVHNENQFEVGKDYLFTDGKKVLTARYITPYDDKSKKIWLSERGEVEFNFIHYAEINLPEN